MERRKEKKKGLETVRKFIYLQLEEGTRYYIGVAFLSTIKRAISFDDQLAFCEFLLIINRFIKFISIFARFN